MKLRNKKTGVLGVLEATTYHGGRPDNIIEVYEMGMGAVKVLAQYKTLEELLEEWEDYKPTEPLIKDEKIRKAVRAWAEACTYDGTCIVEYDKRANELSGLAHTTIIALGEIDFDLEDRKRYTIAELCGEEEE